MRSRHPGISPEKMAIAVAVTIVAIAGIGAMKKVTGTSSAVAIVAVNPGTAPTNRPNSDASSMASMVLGANTMAKACRTAEPVPVTMRRLSARPRAAARAAAGATAAGRGRLASPAPQTAAPPHDTAPGPRVLLLVPSLRVAPPLQLRPRRPALQAKELRKAVGT